MPQRNIESIRKSRERGIAVYLTAFFLLAMIPIVGLAIDGGYAFVIRGRLQSAADAAALAAGRSVNLADTVSAADTAAEGAAQNFFNANFPTGYMNTTGASLGTWTSGSFSTPCASNVSCFQVNYDTSGNPTGTLTIQVAATVTAPTYFMRLAPISTTSLAVNAVGTATRRNLVMELVLDRSASMGSRNTAQGHIPASIGTSSCEAMVYSSIQFIKYFSPYDKVGEISFDYTVYDDNNASNDGSYTASNNFLASGASGMANSISWIGCGNNTNTTAALYKAWQDIQAVNQKLAVNVIVLFTDGVPNGINATFPIRNSVDSRYGPSNESCSTGNNFTAAQVSGGCSGATCIDGSGQTLCTNTNASAPTSVPGAAICPGATGCVAGTAAAGGSGLGGLNACTATAGLTIKGVITQTDNFSIIGGSRVGPEKQFSTDSTPALPSGASSCPSSGTAFSSQTVAYIPDNDSFGNSTLHYPSNNGAYTPTPPTSSTNSPWYQWLYGDANATADHVNYQCAAAGTVITAGNAYCKNLGSNWTNPTYSGLGAGHNTTTFSGGPYMNHTRPDLPNSIGTASMTSAANMAYVIRSDNVYNPIIDTVYLQGNGSDPVDPAFLQMVTNQSTISPIIYQGTPSCSTSYFILPGATGCLSSGAYTNPFYVSSQQTGLWEQTASITELNTMFQIIASSLLRLSQ